MKCGGERGKEVGGRKVEREKEKEERERDKRWGRATELDEEGWEIDV